MTLDVDSAAPWLVARGLADAAAIVLGDLKITSAPRRNRNLRIERRRGRSFLLKQPDPGEPESERTLRAEIGFYRMCREVAGSIAGLLPALCDDDLAAPRLVVELLPGARTLSEEHRAHPAEALPLGPSRAVGRALGTIHAIFRSAPLKDHPFVTGLSAPPPWILSAAQPSPAALGRLGPARRQTLSILQTDVALAARLAALAEGWRASTVLHGDLKGDNILVLPSADGAPGEVRLVDWELVQRGDPAWDVAGVLQDALVFWIASMPSEPSLDPDERAARATYPLPALQPPVGAFWSSYRQAAGLAPAESAELLRRAVELSAARLVQSAYEHGAAGRLTSAAVLMLQLAANILDDPLLAALHLYGLPPCLPHRPT